MQVRNLENDKIALNNKANNLAADMSDRDRAHR